LTLPTRYNQYVFAGVKESQLTYRLQYESYKAKLKELCIVHSKVVHIPRAQLPDALSKAGCSRDDIAMTSTYKNYL
jgi:hypothetical protein